MKKVWQTDGTIHRAAWSQLKTIGHPSYLLQASYVHHFIAIDENWYYSPEMNLNQNQQFFFLSWVTLKFDEWPWKKIAHLFYAISSLVHHFIDIGQFKLQLQSGDAQFSSKLAIFLSHVTLKFDGWPWKTKGHLCHIKLCASFHCHMWVRTGVTVQKQSN